MKKYPVTEVMRQLITQAIRSKRVTRKQLSDAMKLGKPWVTKLLDATTQTIREDHLQTMQDFLGINFFAVEEIAGSRSPIAQKMSARIDVDPTFAKLVVMLDSALREAREAITPRFIPTRDMSKMGSEMIKIATDNSGMPGKVAREILNLLSHPPPRRARGGRQ